MKNARSINEDAIAIFRAALSAIDAEKAVSENLRLVGPTLNFSNLSYKLRPGQPLYAVALGKAALAMAAGLSSALGPALTAGVVSGPTPNPDFPLLQDKRWQVFQGGHPAPDAGSLASARAAIDMLAQASSENALVVFLVSGGGSAMMELPRDEKVTLKDLQEMNHLLVTSGAPIEAINAVRRAVSAVKGGGLARAARYCDQLTLIVSDTDVASDVASGPTFPYQPDTPAAIDVLRDYDLRERMPSSVLHCIEHPIITSIEQPVQQRGHVTLLSSRDAVNAAMTEAEERGYFTDELKFSGGSQPDAESGARLTLQETMLLSAASSSRNVCLVSAGEFNCKVTGDGIGGRNSETVLRWALNLERLRISEHGSSPKQLVFLSAGTDGIDGNSPAAGSIADENSIARAISEGLDPQSYLENSDSYSFFCLLGDAIVTGVTHTNVRDIRIALARNETAAEQGSSSIDFAITSGL
ncbi:MAG: glycerate kinase [Candidatus Udaeobacter sp.]